MKSFKGKKFVSLLLLAAVSATAVCTTAFAGCEKKNKGDNGNGKVYYVSPDGKRDAAGTENDPKNIWYLLHTTHDEYDVLEAGDTVMVMPGEYVMNERIMIVETVNGTYDKPITIKNADPSKKATISFYNMPFSSLNRGVSIYGNYFIWDGIDVCGAGDNGLYIGGSFNVIQNSEFYDNRDTGLQLGRSYSEYNDIATWPSYNLIKNCTSYNNYDNETYGENADGFAAKLTVGYGNVFDGCIAYRNSDDGWDLYAKNDSGNIGQVIMYNCVAFENGYIAEPQESFNKKFPKYQHKYDEAVTSAYSTRDGDGNGFKLGGSVMEGEVLCYNCLSFNNRMHGVTDNSNPGVITIDGITAYNNATSIDNVQYIAKKDGETLVGVNIAKDSQGNWKVTKKQTQTVEGEEVEVEVDVEYDEIAENPTYGYIKYGKTAADECANIDLARQTYSYNHIANVLSVNKDDINLQSDAYRGTVENCSMWRRTSNTEHVGKSLTISDVDEYDTKVGISGTVGDALAADDVFKQLPTMNMGISKTIHKEYRNEDGSINMHDILAQKNAASTYGSVLNKTGWDEYKHYDFKELLESASSDDAVATAVQQMVYLPIRTDAVFQDFDAVTKMLSASISWVSSDPSILRVTEQTGTSYSLHQDVRIEVLRPEDEDKVVTLTATVKVGEVSKNKSFDVTVKKNQFKIGKIAVEGVAKDEIIVDQGSGYALKDPTIYNATSDSGKTIDPKLYNIAYSYRLAKDSDSEFEIKDTFTARTAGIWEINMTVTLKDGVNLSSTATKTGNYTYRVYVASTGVKVDFATDSTTGESTAAFYVNKNGFTLYGTPSNPAGILYVTKVATGSTAPTAEELKANGTKYDFKTTALSIDYATENSDSYDVYYVFENTKQTIFSDVHKLSVTTQDIRTKADFESMLANSSASVIYRLVNDLDLSGQKLTTSFSKFIGLFNGMGNTVKNVSLERVNTTSKSDSEDGFGIFCNVKDGTIMNVTFENIDIVNGFVKAGIIGLMDGGYVYNVKMHNVSVSAPIRAGGLIGQIIASSGEGATTYIDRVELINDKEYVPASITSLDFEIGKYFSEKDGVYTPVTEYSADITTYYTEKYVIKGDRSAGIVGFIQAGNANRYNKVYISNCYVDARMESGDYCGGIVGRSDDRNANDYLSITGCYYKGTVSCLKRAGGILGGFTGTGVTRINKCLSIGLLYHADPRDIVLVAQKNCSCILGNYAGNADMKVSNCYGTFEEYNSDYEVELATPEDLVSETFYTRWFKLDTTVWEYVKDGNNIVGPYIRIKNIGKMPSAE